MRVIIDLDSALVAAVSDDGSSFDQRTTDALRLWSVLENPEEVLAAHDSPTTNPDAEAGSSQ